MSRRSARGPFGRLPEGARRPMRTKPAPRSSGKSRLLIALAMAGFANLVNMKYGRDDELESDELGVRFMSEAGYDPRAMIAVQQLLAEASGGQAPPEILSTHPGTGNRIETIQEAIDSQYPSGVPDGMIP